MKKTYLQPASQALSMVTEQLIAASITGDSSNAEVTLDDEEYDGSFNARRRDLWQEDEEERWDEL